jgi:hypothetical protein
VIHSERGGGNASGLMVRRTLRQLDDTIREAKRIYLTLGATWYASESRFEMANGSQIKFRNLETDTDAEALQGQSFSFVAVEEIGNFPDSSLVLKLFALLRSAHGIKPQFIATGNPGGPGHAWVKARYISPAPLGNELINESFTNPFTGETITKSRIYLPSKLSDNAYLGTDYVANLYKSGSERLVRSWLFGDWSVIEGAFFENWSDAKHICPPFQIPRGWVRFRSMDWGSAVPFSIGWYAVCGDTLQIHGRIIPRGCLIKYKEWYGCPPNQPSRGLKMTVEAVSEGIHAREKDEPRNHRGMADFAYSVADPAIFHWDGGPSLSERFQKCGIFWSPAVNRRVTRDNKLGGWDLMRMRLEGTDEGQHPMLIFFSNCRYAVELIPPLQHDPAKPEDVDSESIDHIGDETRYACASRPFIRQASLPIATVSTPAGPVEVGPPPGPGGEMDIPPDGFEIMARDAERKWKRRLSLVSNRI